jgi:hypothetical protein
MNPQTDLATLVRATFAGVGEFRACAFFDERLDCIRIITKDCSVLEERISDRVTILLNLYDPKPGRKECVGFTLKGARHFCHQHALSMVVPLATSTLMDKMLASFPEKAVQVFIELVAKPLIDAERIEQVDMSELGLTADTELQPA